MRIAVLGAGPAGLYFSILMKKARPDCEITVVERNRPEDTFGWGVVFSDKTMDGFRAADAQVVDEIERSFRHWDDIHLHFEGRKLTSSGHGFCGIARVKLLDILRRRAEGLGVSIRFDAEFDDPDEYARAFDLVVGADGVNSVTRRKHADHFRPGIDVRKCRFIWLGTKKKLDAFTFAFRKTEHGWFNLHAYRFDEEWSTFIVETPEETFLKAGLDQVEPAESIAYCERLFADLLDGHSLISNARHLRGSAVWIKFNRVLCERWFKDNIVLIGDAAHTAHFSIGSGTKLAMEDAIALVSALSSTEGDVPTRLGRYQAEREVEALKLQSAARNRMTWFEEVERYTHLPPEQFFFALLTGSQRVGHASLAARDPAYAAGYDRWFSARSGAGDAAIPPMFTPYSIGQLRLENRVVMAPMCMYSATDGVPNEFHFVHYGARAMGGAGLILTEMTNVAADARITPGCTGMWNETQRDAWRRIVDHVHASGSAKIGLQLGHAGRKGATRLPHQGVDLPLSEGGWPLVAPSALPYLPGVSQTPKAMDRADMEQVIEAFVRGARLAAEAGFDLLELHAAHGYLLSSFLSPLTNRRTDEYGGALAARAKFPLEVFRAVREAWPTERPMSVRISAHDWVHGGNTPEDAVLIARLFADAGVDIVHVSSGQVSPDEKPVYGRMFQVPFADRIRNETGIPTIAVGNISEADQVNTIIAAGRADLCALARPHLSDPAWTLHAAAELGYPMSWPRQYEAARLMLTRQVQRNQLMQSV